MTDTRPGEKKPEENSDKTGDNANLDNTQKSEIQNSDNQKSENSETKKPKFDAMKASPDEFKQACAELAASERERKPIPFPGFTGSIAGKAVKDMTPEEFREAERQLISHKGYTGSASMPAVFVLD